MKKVYKQVTGWIGVGITLLVAGLWSYWGTIENFHEGWYSTSIWENIFMLFFQYLIIPIVCILLALIILRWKKIGLFLHIGVAAFSIYFFSGASFQVLWLMIVIPICALGLLYYVGYPEPKRWAYRLIIFIPLIIIFSIGISQGIRISKRMNDHDFGMRIVYGNDITLVFAPRGPGWPDEGVSWNDARHTVKYLAEDGYTLMDEEQNIWRLPTVDEMVRLMMLHNVNAGGIWDEVTKKATYEMTPDKETPLWDINSPVIYYWTSNEFESDSSRAYIIVYHGGIFTRVKTESQRYLSFRAVKENG